MGKQKRPKPSPLTRVAADTQTPAANPLAAWILALGAVAFGLAVALSSLHPRPNTWGLDAPGYLPAPLHALVLVIVATGAALLVAAAANPSASHQRPSRIGTLLDHGRLQLWIPLLLLLSAAMWLFRVRSFFLGDQQVWLDNIRSGRYPLFSEPLAALAWQGYGSLLRILAIPPLEKWLAVFPVFCGIASAALAWQISRYITNDRNTRVLGLVLIVTLGTAQLFCGYLESYAVVIPAVLLYILVGLRHAHGEGSLLLVGLCFVLAVATHLVALFLLPSYFVLVLRAKMGTVRRAGFMLLPVAVAGGVAWLLEIPGAEILRPFHVLRVAVVASGQGSPQPAGPEALADHVANLANLILLTMAVPALLLLSRVLAGSLRTWVGSPDRAFLVAAAIPGILVAAALVVPGSPAQDWDLMSVTVLPAALLGILVGLSPNPNPPSNRLGFGLAMLAVGPLFGFILVNASEDAGARRFKVIIDPSIALSAHERAYANEKLVKYYLLRKEPDSTLVYAQRALAAEPDNPRFRATIGTALYNLRRYGEAASYLEEAIQGGLDRAEVYYQLGLCYMRERRYEDALGKFHIAVNLGAKPEYLHNLGLAMLATGDPSGAHSVWSYIREHSPEYEPTARAFERHFGGAHGQAPQGGPLGPLPRPGQGAVRERPLAREDVEQIGPQAESPE